MFRDYDNFVRSKCAKLPPSLMFDGYSSINTLHGMEKLPSLVNLKKNAVPVKVDLSTSINKNQFKKYGKPVASGGDALTKSREFVREQNEITSIETQRRLEREIMSARIANNMEQIERLEREKQLAQKRFLLNQVTTKLNFLTKGDHIENREQIRNLAKLTLQGEELKYFKKRDGKLTNAKFNDSRTSKAQQNEFLTTLVELLPENTIRQFKDDITKSFTEKTNEKLKRKSPETPEEPKEEELPELEEIEEEDDPSLYTEYQDFVNQLDEELDDELEGYSAPKYSPTGSPPADEPDDDEYKQRPQGLFIDLEQGSFSQNFRES